ncbi:hypothetical protein [Tropicimonas sp. S265A]|uniref:hypothetical protein n=1 Tax=Tropicimonas sp. S265A TaxID=3415134 RepID=UPI003C7C6CBD
MFFAAQDWLSEQWIWVVVAVLFVVGVGVIWPLSDASFRNRARPLRRAKLAYWRAQDVYTRPQATFLWFGHEPPRKHAEIEAWLRRSSSLRVLYMQLCQALGPDTGDADVLRKDLKHYAGMRLSTRGERIPSFLRDSPTAQDDGSDIPVHFPED